MSNTAQVAEGPQAHEISEGERVGRSLKAVSRTFDDLLCAAEGIQQLGRLISAQEEEAGDHVHAGYAVQALGCHVQILRNQAAQELKPAFQTLDAEPIGY